jgi:predicted amidohydrolase YtcJ
MNNTVFYNGKIYTMSDDVVVEAIYVVDGKIKDLGSNDEILSLKSADDKIVDLEGKVVVPGFNDAHMHLFNYGRSLDIVDLNNTKSQEEIIDLGLKFLEEHKLGENQWLVGSGWIQENFHNKKLLNRHDLDKISMEIPIVFSRACHHIVTCNTKALELAHITAETKIDGGEIEVENGQLTGVLKENACDLVNDLTAVKGREEIKKCILQGIKKLSSYGVTSIHSDDLGAGLEIIDIFKELTQEGKMDVRVYEQCRISDVDDYKLFYNDVYKNFEGNEDFKLGSFKILADGSLGGRTGYMNEPYSDDDSTCGISIYDEDTLLKLIKTAHDFDMSVAIHAIGDRTVDLSIIGIEEAQKSNPKPHMRHGIVHCQITSQEALKKFKEDNIIAYIQPIFVATDYKVVEKRVGERAKYSYNWKTLLDSGVKIPFGTDSPVETPNTFKNIYCAVTRKDMEGKPEGGWLPEQILSVKESVKAYTYDGAYASYEEDVKGTLSVGKYADMAVLSEDIFEIDTVKIKDVTCVMTVKGGNVVYECQ